MSIIPERFADIMQSTALAYLATTGPDGAAQVSPVWFIWDGAALRFSTLRARQKCRNMEREPRMAVAITDPANPYRSLELRGTVVLEDDPDKLYPHVVNRKYLGTDADPAHLPPEDKRVIGVFTPEKVLVFGA